MGEVTLNKSRESPLVIHKVQQITSQQQRAQGSWHQGDSQSFSLHNLSLSGQAHAQVGVWYTQISTLWGWPFGGKGYEGHSCRFRWFPHRTRTPLSKQGVKFTWRPGTFNMACFKNCNDSERGNSLGRQAAILHRNQQIFTTSHAPSCQRRAGKVLVACWPAPGRGTPFFQFLQPCRPTAHADPLCSLLPTFHD